MPVYVAKLQCPNGHPVLGAAFERLEGAESDTTQIAMLLKGKWRRMVDSGKLKLECPVCGSVERDVEVIETQYKSMRDIMDFVEQDVAEEIAAMQARVNRHGLN